MMESFGDVLFGEDPSSIPEDFEDVLSRVPTALDQFLGGGGGSGHEDTVVAFASGLLNEFYRLNWTGPPALPVRQLDVSREIMEKWNSQSLEKLSWDGEPAYPLVSQPFLLCLAHSVLVDNGNVLGEKAVPWAVRCLFTEQRLLPQRSETLWSEIQKRIDGSMTPLLESGKLTNIQLCELHLELGHITLYYYQYSISKAHFDSAQSLAGLTTKLTGALGRRTHFQQNDTAQLLLQVEVEEANTDAPCTCSCLPKDLALGDDTVLDRVRFSEPQSSSSLSSLQQAVILGQCVSLQKTNPVHRLTTEEMEAYLSCVLAVPQSWVIQFLALFLRCRNETGRSRQIQRAMMQLELLVGTFKEPSPAVEDRLQLFHLVPLPPHWDVEKALASVLMSLGSVKSALEVYQRLAMWEEVAECLCSVGRKGKAEEVVREQLAVKETPILWCLLGDVTGDPKYYRRAWALSGQHSSRAQRSLGMHYLRKEMYKECVESLQLSLQINSLQEGVWFSLGCAASKIEDQDLAAKAFHRCVILDPDNGMAWNNLAAVYLRKKDKVKAFRFYQEAVKFSFESWKIWENLLITSLDIGEFESVIKAYHRLLDLREKFTDVEVLGHLVGAVVKAMPDRSGNPASHLRKKLGELLGRITSQTTSSADVWLLYADYHFASENVDDHSKGVLELQKAQRACRVESGWEKDEGRIRRVTDITLRYCQACRQVCADGRGKSETSQNIASARLALQGVISRAKNFIESCPDRSAVSDSMQQMEEEMEQLRKLL